ncbi:Signal transduction histidine kinase [Ignavibacterium album JCM 16511]|uniref:histidine kinase n=1 Tax=Ignavibacterium album (strain DSM 19864 / JCM 16511 / NBRC 101810 / Mat9-16) TaxID=945713 RepID=I0AGU5_IGNAJ|nr:PAS domain S-box protein [Ignavibacterium album]AFH48202.1 Signal transduction histidine kinase [Ignavibacterium album JCM 16511]
MENKFRNNAEKNFDLKSFEILNDLPIGIIITNSNLEIEFINRIFLNLCEYYNLPLSTNLISQSIFSISSIFNSQIKDEIESLLNGFPFEKEISNSELQNKGIIRLVIKANPLLEKEELSGAVFVIEDIKIVLDAISDYRKKLSHLQSVIEKSYDFYFLLSDDFSVLQHSRELPDEFNQITEISGFNDFKSILTPQSNFELIQNLEKCLSTKEVTTFICETTNQSRFECRIIPVLNQKEDILLFYLFFRNIIQTNLQAESTSVLSEELEYYKSLFNAFDEIVFVYNKDYKIAFLNSQAEKFIGKKKSELYDKPIHLFVKFLSKEFLSGIEDKLKTKPFHRTIITEYDDLRNKIVFECTFTKLDDYKNHTIVKCEDITSKIHFEENLISSLKGLKQTILKAPQMICQVDLNGQILFANEALIFTLGFNEEDLLSTTIYDLIDPEYFDKNVFELSAFSAKPSSEIELPIRTKWDTPINLQSVFIPVFDELGNLQHISCYFNHLEEIKSKEKELKLYQSLVEASNDGIALVQDGRIIIANKSFANIFGYDIGEELLNKEVLDLSSNDDIIKVAEYFRLLERKKEAPSRFDFLGKKRDNSYLHTEISVGTFDVDKKTYIVLIARDITERIRAQKAIRESEEKYRNITENIDDFLFTFERIGFSLRPVFCTSSIQKICGYTQTDFLSDSKLFLKIIHPDDFKVLKPKLMSLLKSRIQLSGEFEFRIINKQGNIVWVRTKLNLIRSGTGRIQKLFGLVSDITFRKRAEEELRKSTQNLIKLNETKDRFISIISHDLRTPFSSILGFTDLLENDDELSDEERKQYIKYIQEASRSMLSLVNSLLDWTRLQTGRIRFEPQKTDITEIINDSISALRGSAIQKQIEIRSNIGNDLFLFIDKSLITQVFNNLISNAIKFTNPNGTVTISASPAENKRFIKFSIKDSGIGIQPEDLPKLFKVDSKFSTEGTAGEKGSGLGLSLVKEIIEKHGGTIWVDSKPGEGSDFQFTLPVASANILIVDDSKTDRLLYSKILKNITPDYDVEVASNGKEALDKILASPPALVITDHGMPVMNGYEFVKELKKADIKGKPQVIVLSSDIDRTIATDYHELGIEFVFQKPVNLSSFKQAVEKSLHKGLSIS